MTATNAKRHRYVPVPWDRWQKNLARRIKKRRLQQGFTQDSLAQAARADTGASLTREIINRWESGHSLPTLSSLFALAEVLKLNLSSLLPVTYRRKLPKRWRKRGGKNPGPSTGVP